MEQVEIITISKRNLGGMSCHYIQEDELQKEINEFITKTKNIKVLDISIVNMDSSGHSTVGLATIRYTQECDEKQVEIKRLEDCIKIMIREAKEDKFTIDSYRRHMEKHLSLFQRVENQINELGVITPELFEEIQKVLKDGIL